MRMQTYLASQAKHAACNARLLALVRLHFGSAWFTGYDLRRKMTPAGTENGLVALGFRWISDRAIGRRLAELGAVERRGLYFPEWSIPPG